MRIILLGPTASGKTDVSIHLAQALNTSIISADSRQCYKYLDIGTAKPTPSELKKVPHYNISLLDLNEEDSAMKFQKRANDWEKEVLQDTEHVLYVGGSTLYLQGLIQPFSEIPDADADNIKQIEQRIEREGLESLFELLQEIDPQYAKKMDGMNRQRIIRALDVWMQTGKPFSTFHQQGEIKPDENTFVFGMKFPREQLYNRINQRVDSMIENGLVDETKAILSMGYSKELQSLNTVGYKEIIDYLEGTWSLEKAIEKIKTNSRRYAKRQLTWFRRWKFIHWLPAEERKPTALTEGICSMIKQKSL